MATTKNIKDHRQRRKEQLVYIMGGKCRICGYDKCISALEFHHCDPSEKHFGISDGNCRSLEEDIEEIKKCVLLCSNCHREVEYFKIPTTPFFLEERIQEIISEIRKKEEKMMENKKCPICGKPKTAKAKYCNECFRKNTRVVERPQREELKEMIRSLPFTTIAQQYGVTDNSVRKWCIKYGLPSKRREINNYTDEEWEKI